MELRYEIQYTYKNDKLVMIKMKIPENRHGFEFNDTKSLSQSSTFSSYKHIKQEKMERNQIYLFLLTYFRKNKHTVKFKILCIYRMSKNIN
jgi:hypothetical protein